MPQPSFRGDPYRVLEVSFDADDGEIKRRWRQLAREHHPDRAAGDSTEATRLTGRMARINAAYDLLRDPVRRERYDASQGRRHTSRGSRAGGRGAAPGATPGATQWPDQGSWAGPPPPPATKPVTGRFDTSAHFHRHNATVGDERASLQGHQPRSNRERNGPREELRASQPNGPVERRPGGTPDRLPNLEEARDTIIEFGKFRGHTLGQVAVFEPTYIDWIAGTVTRDRDLVVRARVIQGELDRLGVERRARQPSPGFGQRRAAAAG